MAQIKDVGGKLQMWNDLDAVVFTYDGGNAVTNITASGVTLSDATDVTVKATTGSKFGQSNSKIGFFGVTPVVRPVAGAEIKASLASLGLLGADGTSTALHLDGGTLTAGAVTIADTGAVTIGATTGTKIGQSSSKIGFFGVTAAVRPTAYTQTYSTATKTHSNPTATSPATTASATAGTSRWGYTTSTQATAIPTAIKALVADVVNIKSVINQIVDDLQTLGIVT